eukprot:scaffold2617_cov54-Phaeocystis_antarctica.AAC.1
MSTAPLAAADTSSSLSHRPSTKRQRGGLAPLSSIRAVRKVVSHATSSTLPTRPIHPNTQFRSTYLPSSADTQLVRARGAGGDRCTPRRGEQRLVREDVQAVRHILPLWCVRDVQNQAQRATWFKHATAQVVVRLVR